MPEQRPGTFQRHLRHIPSISPDIPLIIDGYVRQPLTLDYSTLESYHATVTQVVLMCAGHTPTEPLVSVVQWRGIALCDLLREVRPDERAIYVNVHSADGYGTSLPLDVANDALLAYAMNGEPLSAGHGYPARLVMPGHYGYKQPKWVQHLVLSDEPVAGYWEQQGRDPAGVTAPVATVDTTRIVGQVGEQLTIGGLTNAETVQVRIDGGPWNPADVGDCYQWTANWTPMMGGIYRLRVRAQGKTEMQPATTQPVIMVEVTA